MKRLILCICMILVASFSYGQTPQTITYQAVVRNEVGKLLREKPVGVRITIATGGGDVVYTETRIAATNTNGLLTFAIGDKNADTSDDLSGIKWGDDNYFMTCEIDPNGENNYTLKSTSQIMSVPYAIYAEKISPNATPAWTQTEEKPTYNASEIEDIKNYPTFAQVDSIVKNTKNGLQITAGDTARWNNKLDGFTETEPKYSQSAASGITQTDIDSWNGKAEKKDEQDPLFSASAAYKISADDIKNWNNKLDSIPETDPYFYKSAAASISQSDIENWNSKMGSYVETDPTYSNSVAAKITEQDIINWNSKIASESDPEFKAAVASAITAKDTALWNKKLAKEDDPKFNASVAAGISATDTANWNKKIDEESDPKFYASVAAGISATDTANWNKKIDEEDDPKFNASVAAGIRATDTANWNKKIDEESDPKFYASVAAGISATDTANWNKKIAEESDPKFNASVAAGINATDTANWNKKIAEESDPKFNASVAAGISATDTANWNKKIAEESDPKFYASVAAGISATDTANWNKKIAEESDPKFYASVAAGINATDTANWNKKIAEESDPKFYASVAAGISTTDTARWNKIDKIEQSSVTATDIANWNGKLDEETDPKFKASIAASITKKDTARWNKFSNSAAANITQDDIDYWDDLQNQIPENVSEFTNDAGYITQKQLAQNNQQMMTVSYQMVKYYTDSLGAVTKKEDSTITANQTKFASYKDSVNKVLTTLGNKTVTVPENVSAFTNDAKYITETQLTDNNQKLLAKMNQIKNTVIDSIKQVAKAKHDSILAVEHTQLKAYKDSVKTVLDSLKKETADLRSLINQLVEKESATKYLLTLSSGEGGIVTGGGLFASGTEVIIKATASEGFVFEKWSDGNTDAERTVTITSAKLLSASFSKKSYAITLSASPSTEGTVTGAGTYDYGTKVTIKATANSGYNFIQWSDGNTDAERTITVTQALSLTASFAPCYVDLGLSSGRLWASSLNVSCEGGYTPAQSDFTELKNSCKQTNVDGGVKFTGPNDNYIIIPEGFYLTSTYSNNGLKRVVAGIGSSKADKSVDKATATSLYDVWEVK